MPDSDPFGMVCLLNRSVNEQERVDSEYKHATGSVHKITQPKEFKMVAALF